MISGDRLDGNIQRVGTDKPPKRHRVTMHDIALAAGCSQATVSIVLNGNESVKISDSMQQRVRQSAEDLGYRVQSRPSDRNAQSVRQRSRYEDGPIAFVVDNLVSSPESVHAFEGVMQAVKATGNIVLLAETQNDPVHEPKVLSYLLEQGVSAIIYACLFTRLVEVPQILRDTDVPVYLLNCYTDDLSFPAVIPGEVAGGHTATQALIKAGHRRIGMITGEMFMDGTRDRIQGYRNALASADLPYDDDLVIEGNWLPSSGYAGTQKLMSLPKPPTAIFCQNDRMAVGCYEALKEMQLSIPGDVSVVGYDNDEVALHLSPPLTTVNLANRSLGRWVMEQFFHGPDPTTRHPLTKLECELLERKSIGAPNTA